METETKSELFTANSVGRVMKMKTPFDLFSTQQCGTKKMYITM